MRNMCKRHSRRLSGFWAFADHSPWRFASSYRSHMRLNPQEQFQDYLRSIRSLRRKYQDQIDIRIGLECEYFPPYMDWLRAG